MNVNEQIVTKFFTELINDCYDNGLGPANTAALCASCIRPICTATEVDLGFAVETVINLMNQKSEQALVDMEFIRLLEK